MPGARSARVVPQTRRPRGMGGASGLVHTSAVCWRQACHGALTRCGSLNRNADGQLRTGPSSSRARRSRTDISPGRSGLTSSRSTVSCYAVQHRATKVREVIGPSAAPCGGHLVCSVSLSDGPEPWLGGGLDPGGAWAPSRQRKASPLPTGRVPVRREFPGPLPLCGLGSGARRASARSASPDSTNPPRFSAVGQPGQHESAAL
jgi:hypothetical protein